MTQGFLDEVKSLWSVKYVCIVLYNGQYTTVQYCVYCTVLYCTLLEEIQSTACKYRTYPYILHILYILRPYIRPGLNTVNI